MAVTYRSSSASGTSDSQGTSRTVPVPAGAAAGDIALIAIEMWWDSGANPTVTYPSGFTEIVNISLTGSGPQKLKVAWKRLTGADSGNYSMSWTGTQWNMAQCILIAGGLASGDPVDATNTATAASGTSIPTTTVTATGLDFLAHFVANENSARTTPPTSFTEVQDGDYLHTNYWIPGSTGSKSASGGTLAASTLSLAALVAIKPAGGGATDLTVAGATQAHSSGSPALAQVHILTVAGATQVHTAGSPALVQNSDLVAASATQQQTSGSVTLTQVHVLSVDGSVQQQFSDVVELSSEASLTVDDSTHAQVAGSLTLTQAHVLTVEPSVQAQTAEQVVLQQNHSLTVADAVHAHSADVVVLTAGGILDVQPAAHVQASTSPTLTQVHTLIVDGSLLAQAAEQVALTQIHTLLVADALHQHLADELDLVLLGEYEAPQEGTAIVRPMFTIATVRPVTATAVVRSPTATATVRSPDETG